MRSALPPASSLACTLYWRHVPPHTVAHSLPFLSHFIPLACPSTSTPSTLPRPRLQPLNIHMGVPRSRCSTRGITMPSVCPTPFNISNAYPIPAPSSHWEFHVADAARRGVTMCSALPPTSSLACTLYWRHVPLPPRVPHRDHCLRSLSPTSSCLHPLLLPRLHCHVVPAPSLRPPAP